ncbi:hypothetical protein PENSPDRAFT_694458 [Peniophora sp. CONT]|nr:hypothetical protein PENSPDRAFT_694458 [Peniophora sp. CONT]
MFKPTADVLRSEKDIDLGILRRARKSTSQPSQAQWEMACKFVVSATANSLSDLALAARAGSNPNTPPGSVDTFADDGSGPNRHIPRPLRYPVTHPSVAAVISDALAGISLDTPAVYRAASDEYGLWRCELKDCGYFFDPHAVCAEAVEYLGNFRAGQDGIVVAPNGTGRIASGNPAGARAVVQLLACHHYESAHLSAVGIEMMVSPTLRPADGQHLITWRWQAARVEREEDVQVAVNGDERRLTQVLRHWIADKGARVTERLRRPLLASYRLWLRGDRAERQRIVEVAQSTHESDYDIAHQLHAHYRRTKSDDTAIAAGKAHKRAELFSEDIANFESLPRRPWPRDWPRAWMHLSNAAREEIMAAHGSGDHLRRVEVERRVYGHPWVGKW